MDKELLDLLGFIQNSQKGSIGAINNVYLPQLDKSKVDTLARYLRHKIISQGYSEGISLIAQERLRQVLEEGWTSQHDDNHTERQLATAAVSYIVVNDDYQGDYGEQIFPWDKEWWKPKDEISNLVRAGALIAAEIDRLLRLENKTK